MHAKIMKCIPAVAVLAIAIGCAGGGSGAATDGSKVAAGGAANDPAVRKAIDSADAAFSAAFKNGDAATAASFYSDDAVSRPPNAEAQSGKAAIQQSYAEMFKSVGKVVDFSATAKDVDVYPDHVVEVGEYAMSFQPTGAKDTMKDHGGYINYWKKQSDGSWKIYRDAIVSANPLPMQGPPASSKK